MEGSNQCNQTSGYALLSIEFSHFSMKTYVVGTH